MVDGNKRIGTHAMLIFLAINGFELNTHKRNFMRSYSISLQEKKSTMTFLIG